MTATGVLRLVAPVEAQLFDSAPAGWEVLRLNELVTLITDSGRNVERAVALENIESWTGRFIETESEFEGSGTAFENGDVLFGKLRPYLAKAWVADGPGAAIGDLHVFRPKRIVPELLSYWLRTPEFIELVRGAVFGARMPRVDWAFLRQVRIALPPLDEQRAIVRYLNQETGRIDSLIAKQEQLIELLNERQEVLLLEAVQGRKRRGPRRNSATGWAESIPQDWDSGNIRHFASMKTGHTPSRSESDYWVQTTIPWFTLADVWQLRQGGKFISTSEECISELGLQNSAAELLPKGTVVLSRTASVGFTGIMEVPMATSQDYWNWVPMPSLLPEFLWYQFRAMAPHFRSLMHGSTHKTIYQADAAAIRIIVPPLREQREIVTVLDRATARMDATAARAAELVTLLRERRQALISAAVTGQIDVRAR